MSTTIPDAAPAPTMPCAPARESDGGIFAEERHPLDYREPERGRPCMVPPPMIEDRRGT